MINATSDDTIVPNTAGAAPNFPFTASQSLVVKKEKPKVFSAGQPAAKTSHAIRRSRIGTTSANPVVVQRYARSPIDDPSMGTSAEAAALVGGVTPGNDASLTWP